MSFYVNNNRDVQPAPSEVKPLSKDSGFGTLMRSLQSKKDPRTDRISNAVLTATQKYNLPPALVLGVIKQESGFKPGAQSHCGAQGLMQLMPETARGLGVKNSFDIEQNVDGGCRYLKQMLDKFDGNPKLALAAYNAGPGNVQKYGGIPPFQETQNYVKSIMAHAEKYNDGAPIKIPGVDSVAESTMNPVSQNNIEPTLSVSDKQFITDALLKMQLSSVSMPMPTPHKSESSSQEDEPPPPPPRYAMRV